MHNLRSILFRNFFYIYIFSFISSDIFAYELPKVDFSQNSKPTIILFSAQSIVVDNVKKYKLTWKTENTTDVQLTFIGRVEPSGSLIIAEKEYQRGPITLTATSTYSSFSDAKTINKYSAKQDIAPVIIRRESEDMKQQFYTTPLPYGRRIAPRRYRRY